MTTALPKANPTVSIDNERVRVTTWSFSVGAETGHHRHEMDYVVVPLGTGNLRITDNDGNETVASLTKGVPYFRRAGVEHNVTNANSSDFAFVEIELK